MDPRSRRFMMTALVGAFIVQTWLVYSDPVSRDLPPLSPEASRGREIWHDENCQSCHQIFGFGGFLGPDLTNLAERQSEGEDLVRTLERVLTVGSRQMPPFHMSAEDRDSLEAFFVELNGMGVGQVRITEVPPARAILASLVENHPDRASMPEEAVEGMRIAQDVGCINCHLPNGLGTFAATDLTTLRSTLDESYLRSVFENGLPGRGMPSLNLEPDQVVAVLAFLHWLGERGDELQAGFHDAQTATGSSLMNLPWFEYR